mgnify:CR=1 FL=1
MKNILKEEISRINELIFIKESEEGLGKYMDSTYLKTPDQAGISDEETDVIIFDTIKDAIDHNMKLVMIRPEYVKTAREFIDSEGGNVLVGTVIDFPNGNSSVSEKVDEATKAIEDGVDELDYVIDYQSFKGGNIEKVQEEVLKGTSVGLDGGTKVKWIIESAALTESEIAAITELIRNVVVETFGEEKASNVFVKTSTGFFTPEDGSPGGATIDAVSIMSQNAGPLKVKASGGIYSKDDVLNMVNAGASRIGTSAAKEIMLGKKTNKDY